MENIEEAIDSDISSHNSQGVEAVENSKMKERCGNVIENKWCYQKHGVARDKQVAEADDRYG
jgi:hypothetical protein